MRLRTAATAGLATLLLTVTACAGTPTDRPSRPVAPACTDSIYLELSQQHPDSLSDRAWARLQQLEATCQKQQADRPEGQASVVDWDHHARGWLWMPAMMGFGLLMWLMMGGGI